MACGRAASPVGGGCGAHWAGTRPRGLLLPCSGGVSPARGSAACSWAGGGVTRWTRAALPLQLRGDRPPVEEKRSEGPGACRGRGLQPRLHLPPSRQGPLQPPAPARCGCAQRKPEPGGQGVWRWPRRASLWVLPAAASLRPCGARDRAGGPCPPASSGPPRKRKRVCSCPQPPSCPQASLRPGTGLLSRVLGGSRQLGPSDLPSRPLRQFFGFCACTCAGGRPLCPGCPLPVSQAWPAASAPGAPVHMAPTAVSAARGSRARRAWSRSCPRGTAGSAGGPASRGTAGRREAKARSSLHPPLVLPRSAGREDGAAAGLRASPSSRGRGSPSAARGVSGGVTPC